MQERCSSKGGGCSGGGTGGNPGGSSSTSGGFDKAALTIGSIAFWASIAELLEHGQRNGQMFTLANLANGFHTSKKLRSSGPLCIYGDPLYIKKSKYNIYIYTSYSGVGLKVVGPHSKCTTMIHSKCIAPKKLRPERPHSIFQSDAIYTNPEVQSCSQADKPAP